MLHRLAAPLFLAASLLSWAGATHAADAYVAEKATKITIGTGVRVRAAPSAGAREVGKLPLGTDFTSTQRTAAKAKIGGQTDYWRQLDTPLKGWVFGGLLRNFDPAKADEARVALARDKLGPADKLYDSYEHKSPLSFADAVEVSDFASRAAASSKNPVAQGELELAHWRAMQIALFSIPMESTAKPPYAAWIKQQGKNVFYTEPSAEYLVDPRNYWKLADRHKQDAIGDAIAWQAANAFVGGECEGFISCMSARSQMMEGEYLKRYPKGKHVEEALQDVNGNLEYIRKEWKNQPDEQKDVGLKAWQAILAPLPDSKAARTARQHLKALQALRQ
ncbi:SH3 domain-containing protein [Candidatus Thiothrix sp. Deng01]|uniref:SH3 domain-containing protein n=1 Tax=Candidatus Thiothrix phosphatis TaxID=3112415 RepID=A0ABU6CYL2_9GAMM|nr:SH3 domain-containing protein [Candidatus Thiothrix sp. Deng01]MEB4591916.1 SH3 domain-containing protein [Candidatus Thiothrix sp. Deng01]